VDNVDLHKIGDILSKAKILAKEYKKLTGKPLGITSEVAEYEAARLLNLQLSAARQPGYDAVRIEGNKITKIQIKGKVVPAFPTLKGRTGQIKFQHEWDAAIKEHYQFQSLNLSQSQYGQNEISLREMSK